MYHIIWYLYMYIYTYIYILLYMYIYIYICDMSYDIWYMIHIEGGQPYQKRWPLSATLSWAKLDAGLQNLHFSGTLLWTMGHVQASKEFYLVSTARWYIYICIICIHIYVYIYTYIYIYIDIDQWPCACGTLVENICMYLQGAMHVCLCCMSLVSQLLSSIVRAI